MESREGTAAARPLIGCKLGNKTEKNETDEMMIVCMSQRSLRVMVSDTIQQRLFNLVYIMMQSRDNRNTVTDPLNCMAL